MPNYHLSQYPSPNIVIVPTLKFCNPPSEKPNPYNQNGILPETPVVYNPEEMQETQCISCNVPCNNASVIYENQYSTVKDNTFMAVQENQCSCQFTPCIATQNIQSYNPPIPSYNPPFQSCDQPIQGYIPPYQNCNTPIQTFYPPIQCYDPPFQAFNPPIGTLNPPVETLIPPIQTFDPPMETYNPPIAPMEPCQDNQLSEDVDATFSNAERESMVKKTLSWASNYLKSIGQSHPKTQQQHPPLLKNTTSEKKKRKNMDVSSEKELNKTPNELNQDKTPKRIQKDTKSHVADKPDTSSPKKIKVNTNSTSAIKINLLHDKTRTDSEKFKHSNKHIRTVQSKDAENLKLNISMPLTTQNVCTKVTKTAIKKSKSKHPKEDRNLTKKYFDTKEPKTKSGVQKVTKMCSDTRKKLSNALKHHKSKMNEHKHFANRYAEKLRNHSKGELYSQEINKSQSPPQKHTKRYEFLDDKCNVIKKRINIPKLSRSSADTGVNDVDNKGSAPIKSIVQVTGNFDLNVPSQRRSDYTKEDLRNKLKRKHFNCNDTKRDNLLITVRNENDAEEKGCVSKKDNVEKQTKANNKTPTIKQDTRKYKKIKLVINLEFEKCSESSESENDGQNNEHQLQANLDLSFLDDFNVDDIVECLSPKAKPNINDINPLKLKEEIRTEVMTADDNNNKKDVKLEQSVDIRGSQDINYNVKEKLNKSHEHLENFNEKEDKITEKTKIEVMNYSNDQDVHMSDTFLVKRDKSFTHQENDTELLQSQPKIDKDMVENKEAFLNNMESNTNTTNLNEVASIDKNKDIETSNSTENNDAPVSNMESNTKTTNLNEVAKTNKNEDAAPSNSTTVNKINIISISGSEDEICVVTCSNDNAIEEASETANNIIAFIDLDEDDSEIHPTNIETDNLNANVPLVINENNLASQNENLDLKNKMDSSLVDKIPKANLKTTKEEKVGCTTFSEDKVEIIMIEDKTNEPKASQSALSEYNDNNCDKGRETEADSKEIISLEEKDEHKKNNDFKNKYNNIKTNTTSVCGNNFDVQNDVLKKSELDVTIPSKNNNHTGPDDNVTARNESKIKTTNKCLPEIANTNANKFEAEKKVPKKPASNDKTPAKTNTSMLNFDILTNKALLRGLHKAMISYFGTPYNITSLIRNGKYSRLFQCQDTRGYTYALKVSHPLKKNMANDGHIEDLLKLLRRDIPKKNFHCLLYNNDFTFRGNRCFLMDYYPQNLQTALADNGHCFHIDVVQKIARQLVSALLVLRNNNIAHLSIKPEHILIDSSRNRMKLTGFDEAQLVHSIFIQPNVGTVNYRPPEVILGFPDFIKIDVWAAALIMYEMATNIKLFPGIYNNDILYKQQCTLGRIPYDMVQYSSHANYHYSGPYFMRYMNSQYKIMINRFTRSNRVNYTLFNAYEEFWSKERTVKQTKEDKKKLNLLNILLNEMLALHPRDRLPIEFVCAHEFIYETANTM